MWIQTYTGRRVDPLNLKKEDVCIEDIAHALSNQCRFSGHCKYFYSVAEHSCLVQNIIVELLLKTDQNVRPAGMIAFKALLHDAAEAYLVDIPRPVKPLLPNYVEAEKKAMSVIYDAFGCCNSGLDCLIKDADNMALALEAEKLMGDTSDWNIERYNMQILERINLNYWTPLQAEEFFINKFRVLREIWNGKF